MAEVEATNAAPAPVTPAKAKKAAVPKPTKATKPKKVKAAANHPSYNDMVVKAITALKERGGSSRQAILKHIMTNFQVGDDAKVVNTHLKMALKRGITSGALKNSKGSGVTGSFKVVEKKVEKKVAPVKKAAAEKKQKAEKAKAPKKPAAAKPKKAAAEKKTVKPKAKKPAAEKKVKKVAAKPKVAKPATKKVAAKKPATPKAKKPAAKKAPAKK